MFCKKKGLTATVIFNPAKISCSGSDFVKTLADLFPDVDLTTVTNGTMTYLYGGDIWKMIIKDSNDQTLGTYQQYTGDWTSAGFTFTGEFVDEEVISFECNIK